jgi:hypothetical protein
VFLVLRPRLKNWWQWRSNSCWRSGCLPTRGCRFSSRRRSRSFRERRFRSWLQWQRNSGLLRANHHRNEPTAGARRRTQEASSTCSHANGQSCGQSRHGGVRDGCTRNGFWRYKDMTWCHDKCGRTLAQRNRAGRNSYLESTLHWLGMGDRRLQCDIIEGLGTGFMLGIPGSSPFEMSSFLMGRCTNGFNHFIL